MKRRTCLGTVWAVRSRSISWLTSLLNLYLLLNAVRALHSFTPLAVDEFAITELTSADECLHSQKHPPPPAPPSNETAPASGSLFERALGTLSHGLHDLEAAAVKESAKDDLASIMRSCRVQLLTSVPAGLLEAKRFYFYSAYLLITSSLALDLLRWCGCCSGITDGVLGFRDQRWERWRLLPQLVMLVPFSHLAYLLSRPIPLPCCEGTPRLESVMDRVRNLAWLCLLVSYCLFADAHNHGFFLLRSPESSACRLLRPCLAAARGGRFDAKGGPPSAGRGEPGGGSFA